MDRNKILIATEEYVRSFFEDRFNEEQFPFHNIGHTQKVVEQARLIAQNENVTEHEMFLVTLAAWFHDTGYSVCSLGHEEESVIIAKEFLKDHLPEEDLDQIDVMIAGTKILATPSTKLAKILCDADYFHLHLDDFIDYSFALKKEFELSLNQKLTKSYYLFDTLRFLKKQQYCTDFARREYQSLKEKNIKRIQDLLDKGKKKKETLSTSRGIESMLRLTARNQINLSSIADNKANILLTVTSVIVSFSATVGFSQLNNMKWMIYPLIILIITCLISLIFAILSTRPKVSSGTFKQEDVAKNKVNLLFFGNFYKMDYRYYEDAVRNMMNSYDDLYNTMIRDQYSLGLILAKKFKLLRIAYNTFMVGITLSVIAFIATVLLNS
jgi:HD superfamily phosphodiesterase